MVPYARFREVNERQKSLEESVNRLRWAEAIPAHATKNVAQFFQELQRDPASTLLREVEALMSGDPAHAQAVRSAAARWMSSGKSQADAMPEPDLQTPDGALVYSAAQAQKLMDWRESRSMQQMTQQIQPMQQWMAKLEADKVRQEIDHTASQWASKTYNDWKTRPHFEEHKKQIADLMEQHGYGIADAYADVLQTHVFPKLQHAQTGSQVAALQAKAAAGTTNPSRGPAHGLPKPESFADAMRQLTGSAG